MAFSGMSANGGRGRGRWRSASSMSEMNVVPLVDVVLVLLIIFMVTASAVEFGIDIEVPKVKQSTRSLNDAPVVEISKSGTITLRKQPVNVNVLGAEVHRQFPKATEVFVRADKSIRVEQFFQVASILGEAKLKVNVVTKSESIGE
jgi:biopolymer transport protein ExbD